MNNSAFEKIDFNHIINPSNEFWCPYCANINSNDESVILPSSFATKTSNKYLGEIYSVTDKPNFIVILTNEESNDCITQDISAITKGIIINITNIVIGDNTIIGSIYNSIRWPDYIQDFLDELSAGKNALIVNAFYKNLDENKLTEMHLAIEQINSMKPKKSAFIICNQKLLSRVNEMFRQYNVNIYQIIKE